MRVSILLIAGVSFCVGLQLATANDSLTEGGFCKSEECKRGTARSTGVLQKIPLDKIAGASKFSAAEFFETLGSDIKRPKAWPEQVDLESVASMSLGEFKEHIGGTWRMQMGCANSMDCSGNCSIRPVASQKTAGTAIADGYHNAFRTYSFDEDMGFSLGSSRGRKQTSASLPDQKGRYRVKNHPGRKGVAFVLDFTDMKTNGSPSNDLDSPVAQIKKIKQTGETVMIFSSKLDGDVTQQLCKSGERFVTVMVKPPTS